MSANEVLWPNDEITEEIIGKLEAQKNKFLDEGDYNNLAQIFSGFSQRNEEGVNYFFRLLEEREDFVDDLLTLSKLLEIDGRFVVNGLRAMLANCLLDPPEDFGKIIVIFFRNWTSVVDQIWMGIATTNNQTLYDLLRDNHKLVKDVISYSLKRQWGVDRLTEQLKSFASRAAALLLLSEENIEHQQRLESDIKTFSQKAPIPRCKPTSFIHLFLEQRKVQLPVMPKTDVVITFIWVGPGMPMKYADNMKHWKQNYPDDDVILYYLPFLLNRDEVEAMEALSEYAEIKITDLESQDYSVLGEEYSALVKSFIQEKRQGKEDYVKVSDTMRIVLSALDYRDIEGKKKSYVYFDLHTELHTVGGFLPPSQWPGDILFHKTSGSATDCWGDDVIAVRSGRNDELMQLIFDRIKSPGGVLTGSEEFDALIAERNDMEFPFLWNRSLHDHTYIKPGRKDLKMTWFDYYKSLKK